MNELPVEADSPQSASGIRRIDCLLLALLGLVLFGFASAHERALATHETVHCLNVREMLASHDWIIPTYGGRPWLERPPLPHWVTAWLAAPFGAGERVWTYRLASHLGGIVCVLLTAWMASVWFGRAIGIFSGAILATMLEFYTYATVAESDITLCVVVTCAMALFVYLEFRSRPAPSSERKSLFGRRPWALAGLFFFLGLTNLAKGLFFGSLFILVPTTGFLLGNLNWQALRRYVWIWGWLITLATGAAWAVAAMLRYPDIVDLWHSDYIGRLNLGYMREPAWYYFAQLPTVLFPWVFAAIVGLAITARAAFIRGSAQRFLWCWAWLPVLFFSIPQGKHHHYLLHCMAPWAVLSALGACKIWGWLVNGPAWLRSPYWAQLSMGLGGSVAIFVFRNKIPGAAEYWVALALFWHVLVLGAWWAVRHPRPKVAAAATVGLLVVIYCVSWVYRASIADPYRHDIEFIARVRHTLPKDSLCYVKGDNHVLTGSWLLFYLGERTSYLHNLTFLRDENLPKDTIYLVGRLQDEDALRSYGIPEVVDVSVRSRHQENDRDRYTLFRLHMAESLARRSISDVRITPCQATGRTEGPFLR